MPYQDLREFLSVLEEKGELIRIKDEIDPRFEAAAIIKQCGGGPAVILENVRGYQIPVVGNVLGNRRRMGLAMGSEGEEKGYEVFAARQKKLASPKIVSSGPVQEVIIKPLLDILAILPILTYHEKDVSPYITQGIVFLKNPETGDKTMGIHRIQVRGPDRIGVYITSPTSMKILKKAEEKGVKLDAAVVIGVDPAVILAAVAFYPVGDKMALAGGFREGVPVEVVRALTVDIEVPAQAMIVIEGKITPGRKEEDGPFGETTGYYVGGSSPSIEITAITHQKNPLFSTVVPWSAEDELIISYAFGGRYYTELKMSIPLIKDMVYSFTGFTVLSVEKISKVEIKRLIYKTLVDFPFIKHLVVVDEDVDIYNPREVEWAIATRFQPDQDLVVIPGLFGLSIDPSVKTTKDGWITSKMGLDATKNYDEEEKFEKIKRPGEVEIRAKEILQKYLKGEV